MAILFNIFTDESIRDQTYFKQGAVRTEKYADDILAILKAA